MVLKGLRMSGPHPALRATFSREREKNGAIFCQRFGLERHSSPRTGERVDASRNAVRTGEGMKGAAR